MALNVAEWSNSTKNPSTNDNEVVLGIRNCALNGPIVMSKTVTYLSSSNPSKSLLRFWISVFRHSLHRNEGQNNGNNYFQSEKEHLYEEATKRTFFMMRRFVEAIAYVRLVFILGLVEVDQVLFVTKSITT